MTSTSISTALPSDSHREPSPTAIKADPTITTVHLAGASARLRDVRLGPIPSGQMP